MMVPIDKYLSILANASTEDNPWAGDDALAAVGEAFVPLAHALAHFVQVARDTPGMGYADAIANLESVVHTFPNPAIVAAMEASAKLEEAGQAPGQPIADDVADGIVAAFAEALAAAPETDHPLGAYEDNADGQGRRGAAGE